MESVPVLVESLFLLLHHAVGFSGFCVMISRGNEKAWERLRSEQKIENLQR